MDYREKIMEAMDTLRKAELANRQPFKARSYAKILEQLRVHGPVRTEADVVDIEGIGDKIRAKIQEILATGALRSADRARNSHRIHEELMSVHGIGPAKARELIEGHAITGIAALRAAPAAMAVLTQAQRLGLQYHEQLQKRIPRAELDAHRQLLLETLRACDVRWQGEIVGSYRRGAATSGDIDMLLVMPGVPAATQQRMFRAFVDALRARGYIHELLAFGDKKAMAFVAAAGVVRHLDLLLTSVEEWPYAQLYFTGSDVHNIAMRKRALEVGLSLNEHGFTPARPGLATENDIFDLLGLRYVAPEQRITAELHLK